jgi:hypothetical protein
MGENRRCICLFLCSSNVKGSSPVFIKDKGCDTQILLRREVEPLPSLTATINVYEHAKEAKDQKSAAFHNESISTHHVRAN